MIVKCIVAVAMTLATTQGWAASILYGSNGQSIFTISTSNGRATLVGATGLADPDADGFGSGVRDLTSSATTLFGAKYTIEVGSSTGALVTINPTTGAILTTTALSGLLETGSNKGLYSIAYDASTNTLFGNTASRLYKIDPNSGAMTFIGALPDGRIVGLGVRANDNSLYAINQLFDASNAATISLYVLNKSDASIVQSVRLLNNCGCDIAFDPLRNNGYISSNFFDDDFNVVNSGLDILNSSLTDVRFVGPYGSAAPGGINGLTFFGSSSAAVPEPSTWTMLTLGFGITGLSMRRGKRVAVA